jgi:hypothetical protein
MFKPRLNGNIVDDGKDRVVFASFQGAATDIDDDGKIVDYVPRGEIMINVAQICAFYDHTIMVCGHKIRVMETLEEIRRKIVGR